MVILVTGASTGLGLAISQALLGGNDHLILTARASSIVRFQQAGIKESERIWIRTLDVSSVEERAALFLEIEKKLGGVDALINNAGFTFRSVMEHLDHEDLSEQMEINFLAPMELIRIALPSMRRKRFGRIINVSSVSGMMAMPTMGGYSASKWALEGASESLWYEVKPWNISVTLVQPGFINSDGFMKVRYTVPGEASAHEDRVPYHWHYHYMSKFIAKLMRMSPNSAENVAKTIVRILKQKNPPLRVAATLDARIFGLFRRLFPRTLYHWVLYRFLPGIKAWGTED